MEVTRIVHKAKDGNARVLLNHTLYGRLVYKQYRGRKHAYYVQGILDDKKFIKCGNGGECLVFADIDRERLQDFLSIFGEITITDATIEDPTVGELESSAYTGLQYWTDRAEERKLPMRIRKRGKKHGY